MKINFALQHFYPKKTVLNKIAKRNAEYLNNAVIKPNVSKNDKAILKSSQRSVGRFAENQGINVEFTTGKNHSTTMNIYKKEYEREYGNQFSINRLKLASVPVDAKSGKMDMIKEAIKNIVANFTKNPNSVEEKVKVGTINFID